VAAADEGVLNLEVNDGVDGGSAADGFGSDLRETDVADVSGFDHLGDGSDGVFNGHGGVKTCGAIDVDVVDAEAFEGVGEGGFDGGGAGVKSEPGSAGGALSAEFNGEQDLLALEMEGAGDEHLIVAHTVEVAGIDEVDAGIDGGVNGGEGFGIVRRAVDAAHSHAAEGDGEDIGAGGAELAVEDGGGGHGWSPFMEMLALAAWRGKMGV